MSESTSGAASRTQPRPPRHSLVQVLRDMPDFSSLDDEALLEVVGASANLLWAAGSKVFAAGESATEIYVILSGAVRITERNGDEVASIGPGDYFGEHAALLHTTHSRTAEAVEDSELMVIPASALEPMLAANPELGQHFRRKLEARLRERDRPDD